MADTFTPAPARDGPPTEPERVPFRRGLPLGRWAGVPITANWTVLATVAVFAYILAASALPVLEPGRSATAYWLTGTLTALAFLATVLAHELAHAVLARHYGMNVKRITLWLLGGVTELDGEAPSPRADAVIAGAGPAASLVMGGLGVGVVWALGGPGLPAAAILWLAAANLLLGVFNLLPGAPLDGGRLLRALLWWRTRDRVRATVNAARVGRVLGMAVVFLGFVQMFAGGFGGLWLVLLGLFLQTAAAGEQAAAVLGRLPDAIVQDIMAPGPAATPDWWTLAQLDSATDPASDDGPLLVLVDFPGEVSGVLSRRDLQRVPTERRDEVRLRDLTRVRGDRLLRVAGDLSIRALAPLLGRHGGVAVVVDEARHPVGIVTAEELRLAALRAEPGGRQPRAA